MHQRIYPKLKFLPWSKLFPSLDEQDGRALGKGALGKEALLGVVIHTLFKA